MTLELEVRAQMIYRRDRELPVLDSREYLDTHWDFATSDWDAAHTRYMIVVRDGMPAGKMLLDAGGSARAWLRWRHLRPLRRQAMAWRLCRWSGKYYIDMEVHT